MATDIKYGYDKLFVSSKSQDDTIVIYSNNKNCVSFTNDDTDTPDASSFFFIIEKEDWDEVKKFIDNQFKK